jgi:hypothetical protein
MPPPLSPTLPRKGGGSAPPLWQTVVIASASEAIQDRGKTARGALDCGAPLAMRKKKTPPYGDGGVFFGTQQALRARMGRFT